jgi:hypothetical protein
MGKPKLISFPIKLRLVNRHKIFPIGGLIGVSVSIEGVRSLVDFEVIEIVVAPLNQHLLDLIGPLEYRIALI